MSKAVSIIVTVADGEEFVDKAMQSVLDQTVLPRIPVECVVYIDYCIDRTEEKLHSWIAPLKDRNVDLKLLRNDFRFRKGVGFGRNRAIEQSSGDYLCFFDIDDVMYPRRIELQLEAAKRNHNAIIGSCFVRPDDSTKRFTEWANALPKEKLAVQIYTTNGPTIIMPTWFAHRTVFDRIPGGFDEGGRGVPEDLIFFYRHLDAGGEIERVDEVLLFYNYHKAATTFSIKEETIFSVRLKHLCSSVLSKPPWSLGFTIWNAGRAGKQFFKGLSEAFQNRVKYFCDVDAKKIGKEFRNYDPVLRREISKPVPIISYQDARPPLIICMKLELTGGAFEQNLNSLHLIEGMDYVLFP